MLTYMLGNKVDATGADGVTNCIFHLGFTFQNMFLLFPSMSSILMLSIPSNFLNCKYILEFEKKLKWWFLMPETKTSLACQRKQSSVYIGPQFTLEILD